jgi:hypothetical protein
VVAVFGAKMKDKLNEYVDAVAQTRHHRSSRR